MHGCLGGRAWLLRGACVVAPRGCAWLFLGGVHGFSWGGMSGFFWGACVVFSRGHVWSLGGHAWFFGGHAWFFPGWACVVHGDEIRSMNRWYASYWNAFLLSLCVKNNRITRRTLLRWTGHELVLLRNMVSPICLAIFILNLIVIFTDVITLVNLGTQSVFYHNLGLIDTCRTRFCYGLWRMTSSDHEVYVSFVTNGDKEYGGFKLTYWFTSPPHMPSEF